MMNDEVKTDDGQRTVRHSTFSVRHSSFLRVWATIGPAIFLAFTSSLARAAEAPRVTIFDADGRTATGTMTMLTSESVSVVVGESRVWRWSDVVSLRFDNRPSPSEPRGAAVWLANGDRFVATASGIADERLKATWVRFADSPALSLPLEAVRGLTLSLPQARERRDDLAAWLLDRKQSHDEVRLLNGDLVTGELSGWQDGVLSLSTGTATVKLPIGEVREIGFNTELLTLPEPKELCWLVSLIDGSRLTLRAAHCRVEQDVLQAAHVTGATWEIPWAAICELRVLHGRAVFLSDLTAAETKFTPFLPGAREWPVRRDRSVSGSPLRVGGREFPKGLGMHSRTVVSYDLGGKYRSFNAAVGLDDTTSGKGTALCAVEVDGRRVFENSSLSHATGPQRLPLIDLSGAKRLTLIVDFGEWGDVQDHVNWCDAVLLPRKP